MVPAIIEVASIQNIEPEQTNTPSMKREHLHYCIFVRLVVLFVPEIL